MDFVETVVRFVGPVDGTVDALASTLAARPSFTVTFTTDATTLPETLDDADCVVCAAQLPDGQGLDVLRSVREGWPDLPFVLLADDGDEALASDAISIGVTDYVRVTETTGVTFAKRVENVVSNYRTERRLRNVGLAVDTAGEGIALLDAEGHFTHVNQAYANMYGYDSLEMVGKHWRTLYPEEDVEYIEDVLEEVHQVGFWSGETTGVRADGSTFPEQHSLAVTEEGGLVCVVRDDTERERQLQTLRERERSLRRLYEVTADTDRDFEGKLQGLFELGMERFDADLGGFAHIDPEEDTFRVEAVRGDHEFLEAGARVALSETYCRLLPESDGPVAISDPADAGFEDAACYQQFGVESYLGTKIQLGGDVYGSFFFVSMEDREREFTEAEQTFHRLMGEWLRGELERERYENRLESLPAVTRELMDAEDADDLCARVVATAEDRLDIRLAAVARLDEEGSLDIAARTTDLEGVALDSLCEEGGAGWRALVDGEVHATEDARDDTLAQVAAVPIGRRGVLFVAQEAGRHAETKFVETFASTVETVFDRIEHERLLQEREETLSEQNEALERLNRVNDIIRGIDQGLVSAASRADIEEVVCRHLGDKGPYELAWVGTVEGDEIVPRAWRGNEKGYLDEATFTVDGDSTGQGPAGRAVKTLETQVTDDVLSDPDFGPWRQAALNRGYRSIIALPLTYEGSVYGVLVVYAGQTGAFSELERSVLADLSETVAYAINAVETKRGFVDDRVTELEFDLGTDARVTRLAADLGVEFSVENVVPRSDGSYRAFVTTYGLECDDLESHAPPNVVDVSHIATAPGTDGAPDEQSFEVTLSETFIHASVLEHGGVVRDVVATPSGSTVRVWYPASREVREFVETFTRLFPSAELAARRERERSSMSPVTFRAAVEDRLTERQLEALQTAYFSGFFESPRQRTGTEVADSLGVSQPTFNSHLRTAHRKLLTLLFEENGGHAR
ncbi:bacterio-opsin activator domain-containing protein [Halarchaeum sp. P4]|uniref:bacterio-opsin activator domain-containing protein n=1 Tax=Halarchaeum sp. P4 TaxID=3421639 RepID=UPI003EBA814B